MKKVETISENKNFTAINVGSLDSIVDYSFIHPKTQKEVTGKVFVKEATKATGSEISFTTIPPQTELPYFHIHDKDEETYIILRGSGYYQVDEDCFPITEGSVIRVAPAGKRGLCNTSNEPMVYICIQTKENSLEEHTTDDGSRVVVEPKWRK
ncbi:MAG: cupin domain-containing protein [Porphyromonadaceae bacterium]|nr:cupin domain-containing protein [uncultured Macellibacteroides sp.]MCE5226754.1 cupin domain-containing protein [Porphyromonadaceae bacterium]